MKDIMFNSISADVQVQAVNNEITETGTMSNVHVINNSNESTDFKDEWVEGVYDEWIYAYNPGLKLLFITYAHGDFENIIPRLVKEEGDIVLTKAEKIARNVESDEVEDAVVKIVSKDDDYLFVKIDWSNKKDVESFLND